MATVGTPPSAWYAWWGPEHPVAWASMSFDEPARYLSIEDAIARLTRYGYAPEIVERLRSGRIVGTLFATYELLERAPASELELRAAWGDR